ncbi:DUF2975 domain-containing protein [Sphingomonas bacterium]|uniref:DUF2975 domain-containing protein n=1 Tax=Sphingomonas bacterium TaxID=1895847 RepID=UPI00261D615F|nr:DUF2975 domain-containing protein [Sphingomonas bacterium]MDB5677612.1 hypothetical protein [Sphingomonas bacterium]
MTPSPALPIARITLQILVVLNWVFGAAILTLLIATVVAERWTFAALGITPSSGIPAMIVGLRAIAALGVVAVPLNNIVLTRLRAIVATVSRGDPFVAANAIRLRAIAWVLLALQLLSIVIAAIGKAISSPANPVHLDAGFSTSGWLAVLLAFILAQVFADGTAMRDDLAGTV